jgi:hypothetical protein
MTFLRVYKPEELVALNVESPQQTFDYFAKQRMADVFVENAVIQLYPIQIPGWYSVDYPQALYGVNADKTDKDAPGWRVLIHSYLDMTSGDTIRLYRSNQLAPGQLPDPADSGQLIKTEVVPSDHNNENLVTVIHSSFFDNPGIYHFWYTVERSTGQPLVPSKGINVWVKTTYPDSQDPTGQNGERTELEEPVFPRTIDKEMLENGITVVVPAWSIMTQGDVVHLKFGDKAVTWKITADQVGQDIEIPVSAATLKSIGPADPLLVKYYIQDQVNNSSRTSRVGVGTLDPDQAWLEAPSLRSTIDDVLALDDLNGGPEDCYVSVRRSDAIAGDKVVLYLSDSTTGFTQSYGPFDYKTGVVTIPLTFATLQSLAPTTIKLKYERIRVVNGTVQRKPSFPYYPALIAEKYRAPAPTAPQAQGAVLSPELKETVVYAGPGIRGIKVGDFVMMTLLSTSASGKARMQNLGRYVTQSMDISGTGIVVPFVFETEHLGNFPNGKTEMSYEVSGEGHIPALDSHIRSLHIGPVTYRLGIVDVGKDEKGVLDPKDIPFGTPATCPAAAHTSIDDVIHLEIWRLGNNLDSSDTLVFADSLPVNADNVGMNIEFWLPLELIQSLLNKVINVVWHIERPRAVPLTAPALMLRIGAQALALSAPRLLEAKPDGTVNPLDTENKATVVVTYPGMDRSHSVTLFVTGRNGFGSPAIAARAGSTSGSLFFSLPETAIPANIGTFMTLRYVVSQVGIPDQTSPAAKYQVKEIPNPNLNYPRIQVTEAPDKVLNLNNFKGDAHWTLIAWRFIAVGTRIKVAVSGTKDDGSEHVVMLVDCVMTVNDVIAGLSGVISRDVLALFKDGSLLNWLSIANFSNVGGVDTLFPIQELTIKTVMLAKPVITRLIDSQPPATGSVANGGTCDDPAPELLGTATPETDVELFNNNEKIGVATADHDGIWRAKVNIGFGRHRLVAKLPNGELVSNAWVVIVTNDLNIGGDASLYLPYLFLVPGRPPLTLPPGSIHSRSAWGGIGPYVYSSSQLGIVKFLDANGTVAALGNGTATITVSDQSGQRASYRLTISGIKSVTLWGDVTWHGHLQHLWRPYCLTSEQFQSFWQTYASVGNIPAYLGWPQSLYWTSTNNNYVNDVAWAFNFSNGLAFQHSPGSQALPTLRVT